MKLRQIIFSILLLLAVLSIPLTVLADTWSYYVSFTVTETSGTDRTNLSILTGISAQNLVNAGYLDANGSATNMKEGSVERAYGVTSGNVTLFIPELLAYQSKTFKFYTNYSPPVAHKIIVGTGGNITTAYAAAIELGDNFKVEFQGYIVTDNGTKSQVLKDSAFRIWVSGNNQLTASVYEGGGWSTCNVTATDVLSDVHFIEVSGNVTHMQMYIDGTLIGSDNLTVGGVPVVPASNWILMQDNSVGYLDFFKIWVD